MEIIRVTEDRMKRVLPQNIIDCDDLTEEAKKVLATLINYIFVQKRAKSEGFLVISNKCLQRSTNMKQTTLLGCIQELIDCNLIARISGERHKQGEKRIASEYHINWEALKKPIKKITFDDLYDRFLKDSETSMGTTITNTITVPISNTTSISASNAITTPASNTITDTVTNSATNTKSKSKPATSTATKSINNSATSSKDVSGDKKKQLEEELKAWADSVNKQLNNNNYEQD